MSDASYGAILNYMDFLLHSRSIVLLCLVQTSAVSPPHGHHCRARRRSRAFPSHMLLSRLPPATTILGAPIAQPCTTRVPRAPPACSTCHRRPLSPLSHTSPPGTPRPSSAGFGPHLSPLAPGGISGGTYITTGVAQRQPRPFLLASVAPLVATSSVPFHSKAASATQQKHGAQPSVVCSTRSTGCQSSASPPSFRAHQSDAQYHRRAHMRHLFLISRATSASPHTAAILIAHRIPAAATTPCPTPTVDTLPYAHSRTIRTAACLSGTRCGREWTRLDVLRREIAAHAQRALALIVGTAHQKARKTEYRIIAHISDTTPSIASASKDAMALVNSDASFTYRFPLILITLG
ncbi:hypothetical protein B0H19DRAFT_1266976 [Mycena capillaripes]|nr:hypothetical protein B0H19DRAFT_1266976 [Mycena capillaripes]